MQACPSQTPGDPLVFAAARRLGGGWAAPIAAWAGGAHRYELSLDVDTLVLGVKNRTELAECVAAADAGPLPPELMARVDQTINRGEES
jgi:hypothetical protein